MRQILIGAWLVLTCSALAACNGAEFSRGDSSSDDDASSAKASAGRSSAGTASSGGNGQGSGGKAAGGSTTSLPPAAGSAGSASSGSGMGGGGDDDECAEGSVTFKMAPGPDVPLDYLCDAGCGTGWLTITDAEGAKAFTIFSACGTAGCESCEILPCAAAACLPTPLTAEGSQLTWHGTYLAQDTCGQDMACQRQTCVPPGRYKAKACAAVSAGTNELAGGCVPKDAIMLCSEAEFDFPSSSEVLLVLEKP